MADLLMLIEEQRAAIRDSERELGEALSAKSDLEKKIGHLQWLLERLKKLYGLTSTAAQDEAGQTRRQLDLSPILPKPGDSTERTGTQKQAIVIALRENRRSMTAREIWDVLQKKGVKVNSKRPIEVVASTMRSSIARHQNIFTRDGTKFSLVEW